MTIEDGSRSFQPGPRVAAMVRALLGSAEVIEGSRHAVDVRLNLGRGQCQPTVTLHQPKVGIEKPLAASTGPAETWARR